MNVTHVEQSDNRITSLLLNGSHLDLLHMMNQTLGGDGSDMQGTEGMNMTQSTTAAGTQQNAIIITAAATPKSSLGRRCWILCDCVHFIAEEKV
jgi:hypothetical protein